jgi:hypothetical protein
VAWNSKNLQGFQWFHHFNLDSAITKLMKWTYFFLTLNFINISGGEARVIYGNDNRVEVFEATLNQQKVAKSVAVLIPNERIQKNDSKKFDLSQSPLSETRKLCPEVKFQKQPVAGNCSGFLIAPDIIATAGHCASYENVCEDYKWVFDFAVDKDTKKAGLNLSSDSVYKCKKVISATIARDLGLDYGLIQLDRKVTGRVPLDLRLTKRIEDKAPLYTVGFPLGLPMKVADGAKVRSNDRDLFFDSNLDTFFGSSGSPVINALTGVVEGILVEGETDFVPNYSRGCSEIKLCKDNECRGEKVFRTTSISNVALLKPFQQAAFTGNMEALDEFFEMEVSIDFNLKEGETALMKAIQGGQADAVNALLERGANANASDALGNSSLHFFARGTGAQSDDILKSLLSHKAKLESKNNAGETPLLVAGKNLNLDMVKLLLKNGSNKNALDANGETVLFPFARNGDLKAYAVLVKLGVDPRIRNKKGEGPFGKIALALLR